MASYLKKEISEWNTTDLCNWLLANKYRGISELFQKYSLSGYDLFYITDDVLKNELNLKSFHERKVALKLITKLTYEHLRLNVINTNGDNVILTLDNNPDTKLGEISDYIGNMFNIDPKDILFKDSTKQEVLSPTVKIVQLLILYPKIYKTLNVSNMKDYRQAEEELMDSGSAEYHENNENINNNMNLNANNNNFKGKESEMGLGSMSGMMGSQEMDYQDMNLNNNNNNKYNNNNNYKMKNNNNNNNMNYRGMNNRNYNNYNENKKMNNNENMKYKYNNNYMKNNNSNNKTNNNQRQNNSNNNKIDDNFLLNSGSVDNYPDQPNNKYNMNGSSSNMNYNNNNNNNNNNTNYNRKIGYMNENENAEQYQDNNEGRNKNYQFNKRNNNEMMEYNEGNNFGLLSSANDDEMKFKPSYQIKNNENNNYRDNN